MGSSPSRKKISKSPGLLWTRWEKTVRKNKYRIVLIEADTGTAWMAETLTEEAERLSESMSYFAKGTRIAFRLPNGAEWMAFFLA
jgi:acyl-CoA synthetase (AMP-forming)/AMP-acid ligase II